MPTVPTSLTTAFASRYVTSCRKRSTAIARAGWAIAATVADGTGLRRFTRISGAAFNPVWSPL